MKKLIDRRTFLMTSGLGTALPALVSARSLQASESPGNPAKYRRADFAPMRQTRYGIGVHWTSLSRQPDGTSKPWRKAVEDFDVKGFVRQIAETGAGHLLFTVNHLQHQLCCPNPVVDELLPGYTHERDLPMELAQALAPHGIKLALYINHGFGPQYRDGDDIPWSVAMGYDDPDPTGMFKRFAAVMGWMGEHYGKKVIAWWVDGGYTLHWLGRGRTGNQYETVRHKMSPSNTPWAELAAAAKNGFPDRLVTWNNGAIRSADDKPKFSLTPCQDYYAGEMTTIEFRPPAPTAPGGLPWYAFVLWHRDAPGKKRKRIRWMMDENNFGRGLVAPTTVALRDFTRAFHAVGGVPCFNLMVYQDGTIYEPDLDAMRKVKTILKADQK